MHRRFVQIANDYTKFPPKISADTVANGLNVAKKSAKTRQEVVGAHAARRASAEQAEQVEQARADSGPCAGARAGPLSSQGQQKPDTTQLAKTD